MMPADPLLNIRPRLSEVTDSWQKATSLEQIRTSFTDYLIEVGPHGAKMAQPRSQAVTSLIEGAWIGQGIRYALFCHGGGFQIGSVASHAGLMARIAKAANLQILGFNYRLAPEHRYPAAVNDAFTAYQWMLDQGKPPVAIIGDSAGGSLALQTAITARDTGLSLPSAIVLISPWLDLSMQASSYNALAQKDIFSKPEQLHAMARSYLGRAGPPADSPAVSPLWASLSGLPPMLIHAGGHDITVGDAYQLSERARAADVKVELKVFPAMCHHFQIYETLPDAHISIEDIGKYLRQL